MVKNNQIVNDLKQHMDSMFSFAAKVAYRKDHPLPVIQSSKSLIGLDMDNPPRNLLKWLDNYVKNFIPDFTPPSLPSNKSFPEMITYVHLGKLILNNKRSEANLYLTYLLKVANHLHIAEFMMELGAKKSPGSFLFCWAAFRSIQFSGEQNMYPTLYHCVQKLLESEEGGKTDKKLLQEKFELYCYQFQIRKTEMVRKNKIGPHFDKMIQTIGQKMDKTTLPVMPINLGSMIRKKGEDGIVSYLTTLKMENISTDLILLLDSLRSALKFSDNLEDPILLCIFDNHSANECT